MLVCDLAEAAAGSVAWTRAASLAPGSPLASEGISLL